MSAILLDGKELSRISEESIKKKVQELSSKNIKPTLATILVGSDPASETYVKMKRNTCARVGMESIAIELSPIVTISFFNLTFILMKGFFSDEEHFTSKVSKPSILLKYLIALINFFSLVAEIVPLRPSLPTRIVPLTLSSFKFERMSL